MNQERLWTAALLGLSCACTYTTPTLAGLQKIVYSATPTQVAADGVDTSLAHVILLDAANQPLPAGTTVQFLLDQVPFGPPRKTDASGGASMYLSRQGAGLAQVGLIVTQSTGPISATAGSLEFVAAAGTAKLQLALSANQIVAGGQVLPSLTLATADGRPAAHFSGTIQLTANDPTVHLPAPFFFVGDAKGQMQLPALTLTNASSNLTGGLTTFTATVARVTGLTSLASVQVLAAPANRLGLHPSSATVTACTPFDVTVQLEDAYGNFVAQKLKSVDLTLPNNGVGAQLLGHAPIDLTGVAPGLFSNVLISNSNTNMLLAVGDAGGQFHGSLPLQVAAATPTLQAQFSGGAATQGDIPVQIGLTGACTANLQLSWSFRAQDPSPHPATLVPGGAAGSLAGSTGGVTVPMFLPGSQQPLLLWDSGRDLAKVTNTVVYLTVTANVNGTQLSAALPPLSLVNGLRFAAPTSLSNALPVSTTVTAAMATDLNFDGQPDYLVASGGNVYKQNPVLGTVAARTVYIGSGSSPPILALGIGALAGRPSQIDLALCLSTSPAASSVIVVQDIQSGSNSLTSIAINGCRDLKVMDINHDHTAEMVVVGVDSSGHSTINVSTLVGGASIPILLPAGGAVRSLTLADANHDGYVDAYLIRDNDLNITVVPGIAAPPYFDINSLQTIPSFLLTTPMMLAMADINRDGRQDLVVASAGHTVAIDQLSHTMIWDVGGLGAPITVADFDGDGFIDVAGQLTGQLAVARGNLKSQTLAPVPAGGTVAARDILLAVNTTLKNGRIDLVYGGASGLQGVLNKMAVPPRGNLGGSRISRDTNLSSVQSSDLSDVNGDGRVDLVMAATVANSGSTVINVYAGDGAGNFASAPNQSLMLANAVQAVVTDWNADGLRDVLVLTGGNTKGFGLTPWIGRADGSLTATPAILSNNCGGVTAMTLGDRNRDGYPEAYIIGSLGACVVDSAPGGALTAGPLATPGAVWSIDLADVNADNQADLILIVDAGTGSSRSLLVLSGVNLSPVGNAQAIPFLADTVQAGDLDGDGIADVMTSEVGYSFLSWQFGSSAGLGAPSLAALSCAPSSVTLVPQGLDQNSNALDLAVACTGSTNALLFQQPGRSKWSPVGSGSTKTLPPAAASDTNLSGFAFSTIFDADNLSLGDLNGDGNLDLVGTNPDHYGVASTLHLLSDEGSVEGAQRLVHLSSSAGWVLGQGSRFIDINLDGIVDLVGVLTTAPSIHQLAIFLGSSSGVHNSNPIMVTNSSVDPDLTVIGDINADGRPDVVVRDPTTLQALVFLGQDPTSNGQLPLSNSPTAFTFTNSGTIQQMVLIDLDHDGLLDLVGAVSDNNGAHFEGHIYQGNGVFSASNLFSNSPFPPGTQILNLMAVDYNADGVNDLVYSYTSGVQTTVMLQPLVGPNTGTPSSIALSSNVSLAANGIAAADLNQDGHLDLVMLTNSGATSQATYWPGNGVSFPYSPTATTALPLSGPQALSLADISGDGIPDYIIGHYATSSGTPAVIDPSALLTYLVAAQLVTSGAPGAPSISVDAGQQRAVPDNVAVGVADFNRDGLADVGICWAKATDTGPAQMLFSR